MDGGGGTGVWEYDAVYFGGEVGLEGGDWDWGGEVWEERYGCHIQLTRAVGKLRSPMLTMPPTNRQLENPSE